jgi:hypothetical protein
MMSWWSVGVSLWLLSWGTGLSARLMARACCLFDGGAS